MWALKEETQVTARQVSRELNQCKAHLFRARVPAIARVEGGERLSLTPRCLTNWVEFELKGPSWRHKAVGWMNKAFQADPASLEFVVESLRAYEE